MRFLFFILLCFGNRIASAQDTIHLDSKSFHQITQDAAGKDIVYAQRNVQLKKKGLYKVTTQEGVAIFTLHKSFYLQGYFYSKNNRGAVVEANYINGIAVYKEERFEGRKSVKQLAVTKKGNDYFTTRTKVFRRDSVVEKYKNREPQLKEKWTSGKLIFRNDEANDSAVFYTPEGVLTEKYMGGTKEKYRSNGEVYYKSVYTKGRLEEYNDGILNRLYEEKKDTAGNIIWVVSEYDSKGVLVHYGEGYQEVQATPEYMDFELNRRELESYEELAGRK